MTESQYEKLVEASWRRPLTVEEQVQLDAWLATRPKEQADWEAEAALNQVIRHLPDAPVASNFTAQLMRQLESGDGVETRRGSLFAQLKDRFLRPGPRIAWALALVVAAWFGYNQHQADVRADMTTGLSVLANVTSLSDPAVLQDFDAIQRLSQSAPGEDEELFVVLTQ